LRPFSFIALLAVSLTCQATACPEHFFEGKTPAIINQALQPHSKELCFEAFAVLHSGITRTPLYSAEHLTRERIAAAANLPRINSFHPEPRLSPSERSTLADYKASGYDRGHMSPNHDMPTASAQEESFSLANMVPQARKINQNLWEGIETAIRNALKPGAGAYVITGPIFEGTSLQQLNDRVMVPTSVYKVVYFPDSHRGAAYIATNAKDATTTDYDVVSIAELEQRIGINLFPGLSANVKQIRADLPAPEIHGHGKAGSKRRKRNSTWIVQ
jgi:endonuclease G